MTRTETIDLKLVLHLRVKRTETEHEGTRDYPPSCDADREVEAAYCELLLDDEEENGTTVPVPRDMNNMDWLKQWADFALKSETVQEILYAAELPDIETEGPDREDE